MSEGVATTVSITHNPFLVQRFDTAIAGRKPQDATRYSFAHPRDAVAAAELSKIEQIVEYLKVLYR